MRRKRARCAEIIHRLDNSPSHQMRPHAIGHHARCERMLARSEPLRHLATSAAFLGRCGHGFLTEDHRKRARHDVALQIRFATQTQREFGDFAFRSRHRERGIRIDFFVLRILLLVAGRHRGLAAAERGDLLAELCALRFDRLAPCLVEVALLVLFLELLHPFVQLRDFRRGRLCLHGCVGFGGLRRFEAREQARLGVVLVAALPVLLAAQRRRARENPGHRVVVGLRDGIEFVIVAPRASEREAHRGAAQRVHLIINAVELELLGVPLVQIHRAEREHSGGDDLFLAILRILRVEQIARDLLGEKFVERFVRIERINHVIPVPPRIWERHIARPAHRVRIARDIEPVTPPSLAERRRPQQPVHDFCERLVVRGFVAHEGIHLFDRRRQAGEVERHAADERMAIRIGRRLQSLGLDFREDETIHVIPHPGRILHLRHGRLRDRLEGPVLLPLFPINAGSLRDLLAGARIRRTDLDPSLQHRDLGGGKLIFRRHFEILLRVAHRLHEQASARLARLDYVAGIAARRPAFLGIEQQAALDFFRVGRVAFVAMLREQWPHFRFEKRHVLGRRRRGYRRKTGRHSGQRNDQRGTLSEGWVHGYRT